jgi:hypothetical protein
LIDNVTGAQYSLDVSGGALTLVPGANTTPGSLLIELADTASAKNYALTVVSGALTLIPS